MFSVIDRSAPRNGGITGGVGGVVLVCAFRFLLYCTWASFQDKSVCKLFYLSFSFCFLESSRLILINKLKGNVIRAVACVGCCFCFNGGLRNLYNLDAYLKLLPHVSSAIF